jgi:mannose-1-phosphate guanylyltransferase
MNRKKTNQPALWPVLIAGGSGTRFWPLSRKDRPKQLLCLTAERPMVCEACRIIKPLAGCGNIFISTSRPLASKMKKALPEISRENFIIEPVPRDTAPAIGLALAMLSRKIEPRKPEPVLAFLPADHYIARPAAFRKVLTHAADCAASEDLLITIGIRPSFPSTNFGYIQLGKKLKGKSGLAMVKRFAEKPDAALARRYIRRGFLWNAGMFLARPSLLWRVFARYQPGMFRQLKKILEAPAGKLKATVNSVFSALPKISFDYAVMEQAREAAVLPAEFGWSDIGSYKILGELAGRGLTRNLGKGRLVLMDSRNLFVHTTKLAAVVGLNNLALVESDDAILVMELGSDLKLKQLVQQMARQGLKKYL